MSERLTGSLLIVQASTGPACDRLWYDMAVYKTEQRAQQALSDLRKAEQGKWSYRLSDGKHFILERDGEVFRRYLLKRSALRALKHFAATPGRWMLVGPDGGLATPGRWVLIEPDGGFHVMLRSMQLRGSEAAPSKKNGSRMRLGSWGSRE